MSYRVKKWCDCYDFRERRIKPKVLPGPKPKRLANSLIVILASIAFLHADMSNVAQATYNDSTGKTFTVASNSVSVAVSTSPIDVKIDAIATPTNALIVDLPSALVHIKQRANMNVGGLIVGGVLSTTAGATVNWPVSFVASTSTVASLQFDVPLPSSFTVVSVTAGPVVTATGKSISTSLVGSNERILVVGLNQTLLTTGVLMTIQLKVGTVPRGLYPLYLVNTAASNPLGNSVIMSATSGTIQVN